MYALVPLRSIRYSSMNRRCSSVMGGSAAVSGALGASGAWMAAGVASWLVAGSSSAAMRQRLAGLVAAFGLRAGLADCFGELCVTLCTRVTAGELVRDGLRAVAGFAFTGVFTAATLLLLADVVVGLRCVGAGLLIGRGSGSQQKKSSVPERVHEALLRGRRQIDRPFEPIKETSGVQSRRLRLNPMLRNVCTGSDDYLNAKKPGGSTAYRASFCALREVLRAVGQHFGAVHVLQVDRPE